MWNSILIPIFFISFVNFIAAADPAATLAAAVSTVTPEPTLPPAATPPSPAGNAPPPQSGAPRTAETPQYGTLVGNSDTKGHYYPTNQLLAPDKFEKRDKTDGFFIGHHVDQLIAVFKTEKKPFSFYLWPREVCSVVEVRRMTSATVPDDKSSIVFKAMEQRVVSVERDPTGNPIEKAAGYYPYSKVEFTVTEAKGSAKAQYQLKNVGDNSVDCRATYCKQIDGSTFKMEATDYIWIATNSPYCSIRVNADNGIDATKDFRVIKDLGKVIHGIPHNGRSESSKKDGYAVAMPGNEKGDYTTTTAGQCCPKMSELYNTDHSWTGHVDHTHVTVAEYIFKKATAGQADKWARTLKSVLLELKEPEKCPWIRLCFAKGSQKGPSACKTTSQTVEIFPKNGIMIRTDDDQAVMLGAPYNELHTFRLEFTDADAPTKPTKILAVRYAMASDVHTGINEFMKLDMQDGEQTIVLQRGPGCMARLNNDWQQTSLLSGKSPNQLKMKSCACYVQTEEKFKNN